MSEFVVLTKLRARVDLVGCYAYIGERSPDAARRFREAVEATFDALARMLGSGAPYEVANPLLEGLRCARVKRFRNYLIFYRPIEGGIDVIRVLHAARDVGDVQETEETD